MGEKGLLIFLPWSQIMSLRAVLVSHPAAEYVKGSPCQYLHDDDHYQDTDELVHKETHRAVLVISLISFKKNLTTIFHIKVRFDHLLHQNNNKENCQLHIWWNISGDCYKTYRLIWSTYSCSTTNIQNWHPTSTQSLRKLHKSPPHKGALCYLHKTP